MSGTTELADLAGENAMVIMGQMARLLTQLDRELGTSLKGDYLADATAGDYRHLCAVTERYAVDHLASTLNAREGDLTR